MDPNTGKIYSPEEIQALPTDIQDRLVPVSTDEAAEELNELLSELKKVQELPNHDPDEKFYPVNRAARRKAEKRNRALQKRDPRG